MRSRFCCCSKLITRPIYSLHTRCSKFTISFKCDSRAEPGNCASNFTSKITFASFPPNNIFSGEMTVKNTYFVLYNSFIFRVYCNYKALRYNVEKFFLQRERWRSRFCCCSKVGLITRPIYSWSTICFKFTISFKYDSRAEPGTFASLYL